MPTTDHLITLGVPTHVPSRLCLVKNSLGDEMLQILPLWPTWWAFRWWRWWKFWEVGALSSQGRL